MIAKYPDFVDVVLLGLFQFLLPPPPKKETAQERAIREIYRHSGHPPKDDPEDTNFYKNPEDFEGDVFNGFL